MRYVLDDLVQRLRVTLDDFGTSLDDFGQGTLQEMKAALLEAAGELTDEVPLSLSRPEAVRTLPPDAAKGDDGPDDYDAAQVEWTDGHGQILLPTDFRRLYELKLKSWSGSVRAVAEADSEAALRQTCRWTRGTPQKPVALRMADRRGRLWLVYWTAGRYSKPKGAALLPVYNHEVERLLYLPEPAFVEKVAEKATGGLPTVYLDMPLAPQATGYVVYRAAALFLTGKGTGDQASRYYELSKIKEETDGGH